MTAPRGDGFTATGQAEEAAGSPANHETDVHAARPGLVAGIQQRQAEYHRLLGLCQQLRRQHRCPGRCVLTGELRQTGMQAFRGAVGGQP